MEKRYKHIGLVDCPRCYGTGRVPQANPICWDCDGDGEVPQLKAYYIEEELKKEGRVSPWNMD